MIWNSHTKSVHALIFSKNFKYLMSGSLDGQVKIWNWQGSIEHDPKIIIGFDESKVNYYF